MSLCSRCADCGAEMEPSRSTRCRPCRRARSTALFRATRERRSAEDPTYRESRRKYAREQGRKYRARHPEKIIEIHHRSMSRPDVRMRAILRGAITRASEKGIEFSISVADLLPLPSVCPILGIPLDYAHRAGKAQSPGSPSVDRIDNAKGYVPGNVWVVSWRANRIKGDASVEELRAVASAVESRLATAGISEYAGRRVST